MSQEATTAVAMAQSTKQQNDPTKAAKASGSLRGPDQRFDRDGNATDLFAFFKSSPEFILGPMALATAVVAACKYSPSLAARLEDGRAVQYGYYDTMVYTVFAILTTFAAHGWFVVHVAQERQFQQFEKKERGPDGNRLPAPKEGEAAMRYSDRAPPRGASVRSTAALLTSWVYAFYPFGAVSASWPVFIAWTCGLAIYWDAHFFVAHKLAHESPTLYKWFHKRHHFYTAPDVFGAYYVTYQSHFMTEQLVLLLAAFAGLPRDVFTWTMFLGTFDTCVKHSGHDIASVSRGLPCSYETLMTLLNPWSLVFGGASAAEHDWHHEAFKKNYALSFTYLDKLFGSYHKGRTPGHAVGLSREQKASKAASLTKVARAMRRRSKEQMGERASVEPASGEASGAADEPAAAAAEAVAAAAAAKAKATDGPPKEVEHTPTTIDAFSH